MTIQLLDYKGKKFLIEVPDNTQELHIKIISGDMILLEPIYFDTGKDSRSYDFNDGEYFIKKENFNKMKDFSKSYDLIKLEE